MKAKDLIEILKARPEAEVYVMHYDRTFVANSAINMGHTIFIKADKTPWEHSKK